MLPGLIDNHTHMAMPFGGTHSIDDYDTGTRAAAAGGTTCIVDFVIQQHPGGLRSSLEEWQDRAEAPPTWTTASTSRSRTPTRARSPTWSRWSRRHLHVQGVPRLQGRADGHDDLFFRVLETTRDLGALTMVHCENGWAIDVLVGAALGAGQTDPIYHAHTRPERLEAEATTAPCGWPSWPGPACSSCT